MKKMMMVLLMLMSSSSFAFVNFLPTFLTRYPDATVSPLADCMTCHVIDKWQRNAYGQSLQKYLRENDPEGSANDELPYYSIQFIDRGLEAIEMMDSDGDGVTNLEEIENFTFPGDSSDY